MFLSRLYEDVIQKISKELPSNPVFFLGELLGYPYMKSLSTYMIYPKQKIPILIIALYGRTSKNKEIS